MASLVAQACLGAGEPRHCGDPDRFTNRTEGPTLRRGPLALKSAAAGSTNNAPGVQRTERRGCR